MQKLALHRFCPQARLLTQRRTAEASGVRKRALAHAVSFCGRPPCNGEVQSLLALQLTVHTLGIQLGNALANALGLAPPCLHLVFPVPKDPIWRARMLNAFEIPARMSTTNALPLVFIPIQDGVFRVLAIVTWAEVEQDVPGVVPRPLETPARQLPGRGVGELEIWVRNR